MKKIYAFFLLALALPALGQEVSLVSESVVQPVESDFQLTYTWGDFLTGLSCQDDFNRLQKEPFLTARQEERKAQLQKYCVGKVTVWETLLTTFHQNKKALLVDESLKQNGRLWGYVKALPYFLFDVHFGHPTGEGLAAQLDRIQNALQAKNPQEVIQLMQKLSPQQQLFLMPVFNGAVDLLNFQDLL